MTPAEEVQQIGLQAKQASFALARLSTEQKNSILEAMARELQHSQRQILESNALDLADAKASGLSAAMCDRLALTEARIQAMVQGIRDVAALPDPVGAVLSRSQTATGLDLEKVRVPIGVIGIIFESRPNVAADAAVLCFKASNAVILRGGREAKNSNAAIVAVLQRGGETAGLPAGAIQLIRTTDRDAVRHLVQMTDYVGLVIPRGGESLIRAVTEQAHVPVIKHYKGVCHVYVDKTADLDKACAITENAKCQRPGVCNAIETLVVHESVAREFLPRIGKILGDRGVELRGDERARECLPEAKPAAEADWYEEYLDLILAVRVVDSLDAAIRHINHYGSHHSDAIVAESLEAQEQFLREVDSACVYANTSTRFTDGAQFGLGAEIGISTDKLHARGPMGLEELTTYKYLVRTNGLVRE